MVPPLPSKALKRQMPFRNDDGIYEEGFIEERRSALEAFVNKIAGGFSHSSLELHILVFGNSLMAWFQVTHLPKMRDVCTCFFRWMGHKDHFYHVIFQEANIDRNYVPGKIRNS